MRPKLLDLFCGAGGAGTGYHRAGFDVTGVDIRPQLHYPFAFVQADALEYLAECGHRYDAIHASPPCQADTVLRNLHKHKTYPRLAAPTRQLLKATALPYIIEGVMGAPLLNPILLCGTMFGLRTSCGAELRRHRLFELSWGLILTPFCQHYADRTIGVWGDKPRDPTAERLKHRTVTVTGHSPMDGRRNTIRETFPVSAAREAMGIGWMTMQELSQAIPPAYTEFIGRQLLEEACHAPE